MTRRADRAPERVRTLPPETQDEDVRALLRLAGDDDGDVYGFVPEAETSRAAKREQTDRGMFASDEEVRAVRAEHGP